MKPSKYMKYVRMCRGWRLWNSLGIHGDTPYVLYIYSNSLCFYSSGETGHNETVTFKLNLTLKVTFNHFPKLQES